MVDADLKKNEKHNIDSIKETYDNIAEHFDATRGYMWKECAQFIDSAKLGSTLVDIGCGNGRNSFYAKDKGLNVTALDISGGQLNVVKSKAIDKRQEIDLIQCDAIYLPLKPKSFDYVMFIAAIHHLKTETLRVKSLEIIKSVLKPKGKALISAWALDQPKFKDMKTKNGDVIIKWDGKYDRFYHLFAEDELENLCKKAGLKVIFSLKSHGNYYVEVSNI